MSEELSRPNVIITSITIRDSTILEDLEAAFKETGAEVTLDVSPATIKSFPPIDIEIVFKVAELLAMHAVGRYALDPVFKFLEKVAQSWMKAFKNRHPMQPIAPTFKIEGIDVVIKTEPYLVSHEWIDKYCQKIALILEMLDKHSDLAGIKTIWLFAENIDDVKVLAYRDSKRPEYFIDLASKTVKALNDSQKSLYVFDNGDDKSLGILGFVNEDSAKLWVRREQRKHALYIQMLDRMGRLPPNNK